MTTFVPPTAEKDFKLIRHEGTDGDSGEPVVFYYPAAARDLPAGSSGRAGYRYVVDGLAPATAPEGVRVAAVRLVDENKFPGGTLVSEATVEIRSDVFGLTLDGSISFDELLATPFITPTAFFILSDKGRPETMARCCEIMDAAFAARIAAGRVVPRPDVATEYPPGRGPPGA